jgi:hypothetical protein
VGGDRGWRGNGGPGLLREVVMDGMLGMKCWEGSLEGYVGEFGL